MFENFPDNTRVWVYPSNKALNFEDELVIKKHLNEFILGWNAHGKAIRGSYEVYKSNFIILVADLDYSNVSGCSIDSSVKCIKSIGNQLNIDFFNRLQLVVEKDNKLKRVPFFDLNKETVSYIYDTGITNLYELRNLFKVPVGDYMSRLSVK